MTLPTLYRQLTCLVSSMLLCLVCGSAKPGTKTIGEILYTQGTLASGAPLTGDRDGGGSTSGLNAACVNCHRPSGLGTVEGRIVIPPITAKYLFKPGVLVAHRAETNYAESPAAGRRAYTDETLAQAIRDGIGPDGRTLDYLMPRYKLDNPTMVSLVAYLKQLSQGPVPGVTADTLHFATIITPDADPLKRQGMVAVLEHVFAAKNAFYRAQAPSMQSAWRLHFRVPRKWQLHVWDLTGEPATWEEQLHKKLQSEPVFAVISGLGGKTWEPVHHFCEQESIPCLMPNVDLPVASDGDFYNVYFSKGVLLEAGLIAHSLLETPGNSPLRRVVQVYRKDDVGAAAAKTLRDELGSHHLATEECPLPPGSTSLDITHRLANIDTEDALVLWLRPDDLRVLPAELTKSKRVFLSGLMGGLENSPIPRSWRNVVRMAYPYELPARRAVILNYPLGWFRIERIPVVAEETQVNTYIACNILSEKLGEMVDNFVRDYLIESYEVMWSSRVINGYYTRLSLAPGQRFASKGGYIARFADEGNGLLAEGDWIVP
jgi:hypothetical protein